MAYSTITDLAKYIDSADLIQLCTRVASKTTSDAEVTGPVSEAIESADAEIDGYLLSRYSGLRGISPVPPEVNRWSCLLALNILFLRRGLIPPAIESEVKAARARLAAINSGKQTLAEDSAGEQVEQDVAVWLTDAADTDDDLDDDDPRKFTQDKLSKLTGVD